MPAGAKTWLAVPATLRTGPSLVAGFLPALRSRVVFSTYAVAELASAGSWSAEIAAAIRSLVQ